MPDGSQQALGSLPAAQLPIVVLDVDGVLNPYARRDGEQAGFEDFTEHRARGFVLRLSRQMGARIRRLPAEIVWSTTWADTVDEDIVDHVGLPPGLRVAARPPTETTELLTNWKLVQVRRFIEGERRPFAWLDDDALDWPGPDGATARTWAATLEVPARLIAPRPELGLTPAELDDLESWLLDVARRAENRSP